MTAAFAATALSEYELLAIRNSTTAQRSESEREAFGTSAI
jgi:hypothetical protein